jgi:CPA2 family monovalent cation:H+ antiporter-2
MAIEAAFYRDLAYVFGAAVLGGAVAKALRQPLILGYVLGGVLIGPFLVQPFPRFISSKFWRKSESFC